jgi:hypothetical protein
MDDKQKQFFSAMESLFESEGWALLTQGWEQECKMLPEDAFFNAKDIEYVRESRIRHELLQQLLQLPQEIERQKAAVEENLTDE